MLKAGEKSARRLSQPPTQLESYAGRGHELSNANVQRSCFRTASSVVSCLALRSFALGWSHLALAGVVHGVAFALFEISVASIGRLPEVDELARGVLAEWRCVAVVQSATRGGAAVLCEQRLD